MTPCPPIVAFVAVGVKPPRWCARYAVGGAFLPMVFDGPSLEAVTVGASTFWEKETARIAALGFRAKKIAKARAARATHEPEGKIDGL